MIKIKTHNNKHYTMHNKLKNHQYFCNKGMLQNETTQMQINK